MDWLVEVLPSSISSTFIQVSPLRFELSDGVGGTPSHQLMDPFEEPDDMFALALMIDAIPT